MSFSLFNISHANLLTFKYAYKPSDRILQKDGKTIQTWNNLKNEKYKREHSPVNLSCVTIVWLRYLHFTSISLVPPIHFSLFGSSFIHLF